MIKSIRLKHTYAVRVQGLFCGVEWTIFRDGKPVASGEAPDVESGLRNARFAVKPMIRNDKEGRRFNA